MRDIVEIKNGFDLGLADSIVGKAGNLLAVQVGELEYAADFGVDKKYFLESGFDIPNESFKLYLIQQLTKNQINVTDCLDELFSLYQKLTFFVDDATETTEGFIA